MRGDTASIKPVGKTLTGVCNRLIDWVSGDAIRGEDGSKNLDVGVGAISAAEAGDDRAVRLNIYFGA